MIIVGFTAVIPLLDPTIDIIHYFPLRPSPNYFIYLEGIKFRKAYTA